MTTGLRECGMCSRPNLRVETITTTYGDVEVGRCAYCDTRQCAACRRPILVRDARSCRCGAPLHD